MLEEPRALHDSSQIIDAQYIQCLHACGYAGIDAGMRLVITLACARAWQGRCVCVCVCGCA